MAIRGGDDEILGGDGRDAISAGYGNDVIEGEAIQTFSLEEEAIRFLVKTKARWKILSHKEKQRKA